MAKIKCVKVRALFANNKVRFARAEQLWFAVNNAHTIKAEVQPLLLQQVG